MKLILRNILVSLLISLPLIFPLSAKAADAGDPAITDFVIYPAEPAPQSEVDFLVTFTNFGTTVSNNVTLTVDFDENIFKRVLVGDPRRCVNTGVSVICNINTLEPGAEDIAGFTAYIADNATLGTNIVSQAMIAESGNAYDVTDNDFKSFPIKIGSMVKSNETPEIAAPASEVVKDQKTLAEPSGKQDVAVIDVSKNTNWEANGLFTAGLKFLIRGKEALAWSLGIKDSGYHNPAIQATYFKVLTVVNSFFIIGLLIIAAMWMFSILIPRKYLRKVIIVYGIAVIFVNFALPLNQLLIDGTGILQNTFMSDFNIANIVQTPNYDDENSIAYTNKSSIVTSPDNKNFELSLNGNTSETQVGKITQDLLSPSYIGTVSTKDGDQTIQLHASSEPGITLNNSQSLQITGEKTFNPEQESSVFGFIMLVLTGLAYFIMSLVFVLRVVILWGLMIISPVLFLLAIFSFTRNYFMNWLGVYAKWLLIGPLMALGIALVVGIWKATGLPIQSAYTGSGEFGTFQNIGFYLPGSVSINTLSNTQQMMEYMIFLIMLYFPIIFAFILTRQKTLSFAANIISDKRAAKSSGVAQTNDVQSEKSVTKESGASQEKSLVTGLKGFFGDQFSKFTKSPVSESLRSESPKRDIESASSLLPQNLALAKMSDLLDITSGKSRGSRNAHEKAIEILSNTDMILNPTEKQKATSVRQEINNRAAKGDTEAILVMDEIHERENRTVVESAAADGAIVEPSLSPPRRMEPLSGDGDVAKKVMESIQNPNEEEVETSDNKSAEDVNEDAEQEEKIENETDEQKPQVQKERKSRAQHK